jgi:hypothetical protein
LLDWKREGAFFFALYKTWLRNTLPQGNLLVAPVLCECAAALTIREYVVELRVQHKGTGACLLSFGVQIFHGIVGGNPAIFRTKKVFSWIGIQDCETTEETNFKK